MLGFLKRLLGKKYHPLNNIFISKERLLNNYKYLSSLQSDIVVAPVLKSNAYGHGILGIAKVLEEVNAPFFCVDSLHEAYLLLKAKVKTPILIMGYVHPDNLRVKNLPFSFAVFNEKQLSALSKYQKNPKVHIKIDTGMHRMGLQIEEVEEFAQTLKKYPRVTVEGIMSHFAESSNKEFTKLQLENFQKAYNIFLSHGIYPQWRHIGASGGMLRADLAGVSNMVRVGKALYGIENDKSLAPVLTFTTTLVAVKKIKKGEFVGYDRTYQAKKDLTIGILPAGYYDGLDRSLSNKGVVTIDGIVCPIIGRVSMNITTIDLSSLKDPKIGQEAAIFSNSPSDKNSVQNAADLCETIPYEILVHLAESTKRTVV